MGIIYCATNIVNNKKYVGKTVQTLEDRWQDHIRLARTGRKIYFLNAIRKYGSESFNLSVLEVVEDDKLNEAQKKRREREKSGEVVRKPRKDAQNAT